MEIERERAKAARDQEVMNSLATARDEDMEGAGVFEVVASAAQ
jgi:hypothetical protein